MKFKINYEIFKINSTHEIVPNQLYQVILSNLYNKNQVIKQSGRL